MDRRIPISSFEPLYEHRVSPAFMRGMVQAEAPKRAEPQLHTHNILFNLVPRRRDPANPLAGTVFDPRRYPDHNYTQTLPARSYAARYSTEKQRGTIT